MATGIGSLAVKLTANSAQFTKGMKRARTSTQKFRAAVKSAALQVGIIGAAFTVFAGKAVRAAMVQETAEAKLAAVLKATGNAAGFSARQLKEYANALQTVTTFGDEAIINFQAMLATFKNVSGETFQRTTRIALDMAMVMDQDLKPAAIQLGKALNDPIKGVSALSKVGVTFSGVQKQMIKDMMAANDLIGAQSLMLRELESEFGGAAKTAAEIYGGSLKQLGNVAGDVLEKLGMRIMEALADPASLLHQLVAELDVLLSGGGRALQFGTGAFFGTIEEQARAVEKKLEEFKRERVSIQAELAEFDRAPVRFMPFLRLGLKWERGFVESRMETIEADIANAKAQLQRFANMAKTGKFVGVTTPLQLAIPDADKFWDAIFGANLDALAKRAADQAVGVFERITKKARETRDSIRLALSDAWKTIAEDSRKWTGIGKSIFEGTRTPLEQFERAVKEARKALGKGLLPGGEDTLKRFIEQQLEIFKGGFAVSAPAPEAIMPGTQAAARLQYQRANPIVQTNELLEKARKIAEETLDKLDKIERHTDLQYETIEW